MANLADGNRSGDWDLSINGITLPNEYPECVLITGQFARVCVYYLRQNGHATTGRQRSDSSTDNSFL